MDMCRHNDMLGCDGRPADIPPVPDTQHPHTDLNNERLLSVDMTTGRIRDALTEQHDVCLW